MSSLEGGERSNADEEQFRQESLRAFSAFSRWIILRSDMKQIAGSVLTIVLVSIVSSHMRGATPVSNPRVSARVPGATHGKRFGGFTVADTQAGYVEEERFFSGTATAYKKQGTWGLDGRWTPEAATTAPYKVRMVVRRPKDAAKF